MHFLFTSTCTFFTLKHCVQAMSRDHEMVAVPKSKIKVWTCDKFCLLEQHMHGKVAALSVTKLVFGVTFCDHRLMFGFTSWWFLSGLCRLPLT